MPTLDENSNSTLPEQEDNNEDVLGCKKCDCCPFGYHIDRDFVHFSLKMLSREGDVRKIQALKEKWRSKRQSMDKLLGIETESWGIKTLSRENRDIWDLDSKVHLTLNEKLAASVAPLRIDEFEHTFTFGPDLDQAVEEFEEVLVRTKPEFSTTLFPFPDDQKFHTFPRLKPSNGLGVRHKLEADDYFKVGNDEKGFGKSNNNFHSGNLETLEEQLQLIPHLQASLAALEKQNEDYIHLLEMEKKRRVEVEQEMISVLNGRRRLGIDPNVTDDKHSVTTVRKRTREASVGAGVTTRDFGVSHVQPTMRSIGVGGRIDYERDSSSPTGSVNGRRTTRGRTFETGIQVNEIELLHKEPPPTLTITEKFDAETQADLGKILTSKGFDPNFVQRELNVKKVITKNIGINVKPTTSECGVYFKPTTREEICNTVPTDMRNKCVGTIPSLMNNDPGALYVKPMKMSEVASIGVNTLRSEMTTVGSSTATLLVTQTTAAQTDTLHKIDVGVQINSTVTKHGVDLKKLDLVDKSNVTRSIPTEAMSMTPDSDPESPLSPPILQKPTLMRSDTYTKGVLEDDTEDDYEPKHFPASSFAMSIPTIPERREAIKPSKEMQGALKVLNDALLRGKTTEHVTSAIGIILHEWFRVSGSKSANAHDVEDYLDLYENYSPELLKYIVNMPDGNGNSAIHYAVSHGNFDVVSVLLDSNCCDINRANKAGYTCIMLLSLAKLSYDTDRHVVCRLCGLGDVNIKATQHGQTALMLAASHGRVETCKILLDAGADINIQDDDGSTALMCAAEHGHADLVNYFVTLPECQLHIKDNDGSTALNVAMEANHKDIGVTLYAHMHLVESSPKSDGRRLSYPPASPPFSSNSKSPSPTSINRSVSNSPSSEGKHRENIQLKQTKPKGYGDGTESA